MRLKRRRVLAIVFFCVILVVLGLGVLVVYVRHLDHTAWQMCAISHALASYMENNHGAFPDSLTSLARTGFAEHVGPDRVVVHAPVDELREQPWIGFYPEGIEVDLRTIEIGWGGKPLPGEDMLVESRRFRRSLHRLALRLTTGLISLRDSETAASSATSQSARDGS